MNYAKMTEEQVRKTFSGFIPDKVRAQMSANREPTPAEIEAARALIAKVEGKKRPRSAEAAE
jgi:hypothetical protein